MPWPTTERFDKAIGSDHVVVTKAEVLVGEEVVLDLVQAGAVVDGSVTVQTGEIERSATLSLIDVDGTLTPRDVDDLLVPGGNQIRLWRGIRYNTPLVGGGADEEYVPLITARFTATTSRWPHIDLTEMFDRAWIVKGALLENTLVISSGANVFEAISAVLETAYPGVPQNFPDTDQVAPRMVFDAGTDPWGIARDLAANIGYRLAFDPLGVASVYGDPDLTDDAVNWNFDDTDNANLALPGAELQWVGQANNAVLVRSSNSDLAVPVRGLVKDTDPSSPTQYDGKYGRRMADPIDDEKVQNAGQAILRATAELRGRTGLMQQINTQAIAHPGWAIGDVSRVNLTRQAIESQICTLDNWTVPMRAKDPATTLNTRARRVIT